MGIGGADSGHEMEINRVAWMGMGDMVRFRDRFKIRDRVRFRDRVKVRDRVRFRDRVRVGI